MLDPSQADSMNDFFLLRERSNADLSICLLLVFNIRERSMCFERHYKNDIHDDSVSKTSADSVVGKKVSLKFKTEPKKSKLCILKLSTLETPWLNYKNYQQAKITKY